MGATECHSDVRTSSHCSPANAFFRLVCICLAVYDHWCNVDLVPPAGELEDWTATWDSVLLWCSGSASFERAARVYYHRRLCDCVALVYIRQSGASLWQPW